MAEAPAQEIILIRKRKAAHAGHHGGAWKVAYADFVTAMMSLFIVLWLTSSNDAVKHSVAQYFNDPKGTSNKLGTNRNGSGNAVPLDRTQVQHLKDQLLDSARHMPNFDRLKGQIEITAEQDGLRIELLEKGGGLFFESGNAQPTEVLRSFLTQISPSLGQMGARISIEGHTDSVPYSGAGTYSNWELSADRANAARRLMVDSGVQREQVAEVRGFADQLPRRPENPSDPSNRRITLIVKPVDGAPAADVAEPANTATAEGPSEAANEAAASPKKEE